MSVTSGFFNSLNGDRKYNAEQMSAIFDGIINDGVFASIGNQFFVEDDGDGVIVGTGRGWFNSAWIYNDAPLPLDLPPAEVVMFRYDAVVIEIDHSDAGRKGDIKVVSGNPGGTASSIAKPTMIHNDYVNQYPLAYIIRYPGNSTIMQGDIESRVGTSDCPYITAILQVTNIDNVVAQWQAQWTAWSAQWPQWEAAWDQWFAEQTADVDEDAAAWLSQMQSTFNAWFNSLQITLDGDVATNLAADIVDLQDRFRILAEEKAVYEAIQDSSDDTLEDSNGDPIEGRTVMAGEDNTSSDPSESGITPEQIGAAPEVHAGQHSSTGNDPITPAMIGAASIPKIRSVTLLHGSWVSNQQTVSVPGVLANEMAQRITVAYSKDTLDECKDAGLECINQGTDTLTFRVAGEVIDDLVVLITIEEVVSA